MLRDCDDDGSSDAGSGIDLDSDGEMDEDELDRHRNKIPKTCPISFQPMKDPVQFQRCGHIFSREGIMTMLKKNATIMCPGGCQKKVKKNELRPVQNEAAKRLKARRQFNESFLGSQVGNYDWAE